MVSDVPVSQCVLYRKRALIFMKNKMKLEHVIIKINLTPILTAYFISKIVKTINISIKKAEKEEKVNTEE